MQKIILGIFTTVIFQTLTFGQQAKTADTKSVLSYNDAIREHSNNYKRAIIPNLEVPKTNSKDQIITHAGYSLLYDERNEQSSWVAYDLTKAETIKVFKRSDKFREDPQIKTGSACNEDYKNSGFDRGHLAHLLQIWVGRL